MIRVWGRMKVYVNDTDGNRLLGRADIPQDHPGAVYEVPLFGPVSIIMERFTIGTMSTPAAGGEWNVERVVLLSPLQSPDLLPEWTPLAS